MLLVTGPTGSGKTTTLYAAISETNTGNDKIVTIEDPVEYQLPGVLQIPVNEKKGLTFARGLRSILRHDPDKIMVGEIRDPETAQIAIQSALTGHLVFTTVHANNVFDVLSRFVAHGCRRLQLRRGAQRHPRAAPGARRVHVSAPSRSCRRRRCPGDFRHTHGLCGVVPLSRRARDARIVAAADTGVARPSASCWC